jgi:hypothetical protein
MAAEARYDMTVHPTHALVRSQSNGATAHQVTFPSCDCADFINRRGHLIETADGLAVTLCKHIAEGLLRIGGWNRPDTAVTVHARLTRFEATRVLCEAPVGLTEPQATDLLSAVAEGISSSIIVPGLGKVTAEYEPDTRVRPSGPRRWRLTVPAKP